MTDFQYRWDCLRKICLASRLTFQAKLFQFIMLGSQGMQASPVRGAAGLSSGEGWKQVSELFWCLRGTSSSFFSIEGVFALTGWRCSFLQVEDGQVFPKHWVLLKTPQLQSCLWGCHLPPPTQFTPVETLQPTSIGDHSDCPQRDAWDAVQSKLPGHSCKWASHGLSTLSVCAWSWGTCAAACSQQSGGSTWSRHL